MSLFDAFKPKWQHSNPAKRLEAVNEMDAGNQDTLERIASNDSDVNVRTAAVKKLTAIAALRSISRNESDENLRKIALTRYQDEVAKKLKVLTNVTDEDLALLDDLKDTRYAEDLLKSPVTCEAIRSELVNSCKKASVLANVALRDASETVATAAAQKVDSDTLMADIAKNSKHASVRKMVAEKIRAKKEAEDGGKKAAALLASKQDALLGQAHHLAAQKDPLAVKAQFDELMKEALSLGMDDKQTALDDIYASFNKFCDEANAERLAEEKAAAEKAAKIESLACDLLELEQLIAENKVPENAQRVDAIIALWNVEKSLMDASLVKRFNNAFFKVQEIQKPAIVEADVPEGAEESVRPELLDRLKALADSDVSEMTNRHLHALVREWEKLPLLEGEDPILQAYNAIRNKLAEKINDYNEKEKKLVEENSEKLRALIEKVKSFDDNEDFRELNKKVRECYLQWKEIVGEQKFKYHDLWQEYKAATSRFQEMQQWENWPNDKDRADLLTEMDAMANEEPSQALLGKLREISTRWKEIGRVSADKFQAMQERFQANYEKIKEKCAPFIEEMNAERAKNLEEKNGICQKIEELVANTEIFWKDKYKTVQELQERWKNIGQVPRESFVEVTERFKAATNAFYAQHKDNLKAEDVTREANYEKKVALCMEAEALKESSDWNATSNKLKQLQDAWKATGPVPKSKSDEIWNRFRTACDSFFEKKRAHFEAMDANKQKNLEEKNAICEKLEALASGTYTLEEIKNLEAQYKAVGMIPKEAIEALSDRFNSIYNKLIAGIASTDEAFAKTLEEVKARKLEMIEKVKGFADSAGSNQLADAVREIQKDWREIGSCGAADSELYKSFREACDDFFTRRRDQLDIQEQARKNNLQKKLLLCEQAEDLLTDLSEATVSASMNKVKHLRRLWKEVGAVPREHSEKTWNRFNSACDKVFAFGRPAASTESPAEAPAEKNVAAETAPSEG